MLYWNVQSEIDGEATIQITYFTSGITWKADYTPILHDYQTVQFTTTVEPANKADLIFEIVRHQGRNSKQNNVTLEETQAKP